MNGLAAFCSLLPKKDKYAKMRPVTPALHNCKQMGQMSVLQADEMSALNEAYYSSAANPRALTT